jgi:hypothetical protein
MSGAAVIALIPVVVACSASRQTAQSPEDPAKSELIASMLQDKRYTIIFGEVNAIKGSQFHIIDYGSYFSVDGDRLCCKTDERKPDEMPIIQYKSTVTKHGKHQIMLTAKNEMGSNEIFYIDIYPSDVYYFRTRLEDLAFKTTKEYEGVLDFYAKTDSQHFGLPTD